MAISEQDKRNFAEDLMSIHQDLMGWINRIHEMTGPERLEMAESVVEVRTTSGFDVSITGPYFISDIKSACNVLEERLKG